ncbi:MAG: radical SAM protein [Candidatus Woesearchaeota archaeon]|nr:radical SAM protein [Candidatus Woesearchaeota archaeon]
MNKQPEIFLISPYTRSYTQRMPLGLMGISSYLTSKGEENEILDFKDMEPEKAFKKIQGRISEAKPRFVGITCLVSEMGVVKNICRFIRQNSINTKIIIGGPHPSFRPQHIIDMKIEFDYLILGEGEHTFYELVQALRKETEIKKVKGIAYLESGKIKFAPQRELIQDLDYLPFPAYDKVDMAYYSRPNVWAIRPIYISSFNIFTSRGCPYNCKFCVAHTIFGKKIRFMGPKRVVEHIEYVLKKYKVDALYFADESFTVSKQRIYDIFNLLKKKNIKFLWGCQTRVNLLDEELIRFMKKNGCIQIEFGIESGSDKMLKIMNKGTSVKQIMEIGEICRKLRMRVLANMLINLPGETMEDIKASIDLVKKMKYNMVLWNIYIPFPGVEFGRSLDLEDLNPMLKYPSKETIDLLEKKYKFALYKKPIQKVAEELYSLTFYPKHIRFTLSLSYWASFFRLISFVFDHRYILQMLKSKRKMQYINNLFTQRTTK